MRRPPEASVDIEMTRAYLVSGNARRKLAPAETGLRFATNPAMDAKRWQRIEALYHEAMARPQDGRSAFLLEACGEDVGLRAEVDALLNEPAPDEAFLAGPALIAAADVVAGALPGAMTGRVLSGYRLESLLGAGGMGEVYRAHDATLARQVAIKVLPARLLGRCRSPGALRARGAHAGGTESSQHLRDLRR